MPNTEKPTTKVEIKSSGIKQKSSSKKKKLESTRISKKQIEKPIKEPTDKNEDLKKENKIIETPKNDEKKKEIEKNKLGKVPIKKIKNDFAKINAKNVPISTKQSIALCKFIKFKEIERAIEDLEKVIQKKKVVPMKGEIAHKKGKGIMSGKYPKRSSENFIKLLNSLSANAENNGIEEPIITEAIANLAPRPLGRFGRTQKKRSHIFIQVTEKSKIKRKEKKNGRKKHS